MIRRDKTQTTREQRANWELETLYTSAVLEDRREAEDQLRLHNQWKHTLSHKLSDTELADLEIMRRVSAVTEGDSLEKRVKEAISDHKRTEYVDMKLRDKRSSGQTEESFKKELEKLSNEYNKIVLEADRSV